MSDVQCAVGYRMGGSRASPPCRSMPPAARLFGPRDYDPFFASQSEVRPTCQAWVPRVALRAEVSDECGQLWMHGVMVLIVLLSSCRNHAFC